MKRKFKLGITLGLIVFSVPVFSQVKFGVKAGFNASNIAQDFKDSDQEEATKILPS